MRDGRTKTVIDGLYVLDDGTIDIGLAQIDRHPGVNVLAPKGYEVPKNLAVRIAPNAWRRVLAAINERNQPCR